MFEISWSELLILGIVTLIFVGPKELPVFLRTLGKYAGQMRRHAQDFRSQFDAAMREAELDTMREEVSAMQARVNAEVMGAKQALNDASEPPVAKSAPTPAPAVADPPPPMMPMNTANTTLPPMPATPSMPATPLKSGREA